MFTYYRDKLQYNSEKYENFIKNNLEFIDNILQNNEDNNQQNSSNIGNISNIIYKIITTKCNTMISLLDKLNENNSIITSFINKYMHQSKLQCARNKKYLENKKKHNNNFPNKVNKVNKLISKRGRPRKNILQKIQNNFEIKIKIEIENGNDNILDFLYCYNYNQKLSFD